MPNDPTTVQPHRPSVFLSYASGDRDTVIRLKEAMEKAGVDVWFDANELGGGDAWDQKIRRQIKECDYFMPVISASTEARAEGYFRREWRLAVERSMDMADDHPFLLPVAIDTTAQEGARVPEKFQSVQWIRVPGGNETPAFSALCARIAQGQLQAQAAASKPPLVRETLKGGRREPPPFPVFPQKGPSTRKYLRDVIRFVAYTLVAALLRLPRWIRVILYLWFIFFLIGKGCSHRPVKADVDITPSDETKKAEEAKAAIEKVAQKLDGGTESSGGTKFAKDLAKAVLSAAKEADSSGSTYYLAPFAGSESTDPAAATATATFVKLSAKLSAKEGSHLVIAPAPLPTQDAPTLTEQGKSKNADIVISGAVNPGAGGSVLVVEIVAVKKASLLWEKAYPLPASDPAAIAAEVVSSLPAPEED
jgi:TIR domain